MTIGVVIIGSGSLNTIESCAKKGLKLPKLFYIGSKFNEACLNKISSASTDPHCCRFDDPMMSSLFVNWVNTVEEVLFVAGLGSATVMQSIGNCIELAEANDKNVTLIYSLPAFFEGIRRANFAHQTLESLPSDLKMIRVDNAEEMIDIVKYFKDMDDKFYESIERFFVEQTLDKVNEVTYKNEAMLKNTAEDYNVYKVLQMDKKEVLVSRLLADLLNPNGSHRQGHIFLAHFMDTVLPEYEMPLQHLERAQVFKEYKISETSCIDIYLVIGETRIPIEIKILAKDLPNQLLNYYQLAKGNVKKIVYITPYGTKPSHESIKTLPNDVLICRSFEKDIFEWLQTCAHYCHQRDLTLIEGAIHQLIFSIESYTSNDSKISQGINVVKLLSSSNQRMKNALIVEENLFKIKVNKLYEVFHIIEQKVGLPIMEGHPNYYKQPGILEGYVEGKKDWLPGIYFQAGEVDGVPLILCIEVNWYLYASFRLMKSSEELVVKAQQLLSHLPICNIRGGVYWEYIPLENKHENPRFHRPRSTDDIYISLFDQKYFNEYTTLCAKRIQFLLSHCYESEKKV